MSCRRMARLNGAEDFNWTAGNTFSAKITSSSVRNLLAFRQAAATPLSPDSSDSATSRPTARYASAYSWLSARHSSHSGMLIFATVSWRPKRIKLSEQPGRKIIAQCASAGTGTIQAQPRLGAKGTYRQSSSVGYSSPCFLSRLRNSLRTELLRPGGFLRFPG